MRRSRKQPVIVAVDVSPRWLYGHTTLDAIDDDDQIAMARAHRRLTSLLCEADPAGASGTPLPVANFLIVESANVDRVYLDDYKDRPLLLCGVYGDACVLDVADRLQQRGFTVSLLEDACLWGYPLDRIDSESSDPRLRRIPRERAADRFPALLEREPDIWAGDPPSF